MRIFHPPHLHTALFGILAFVALMSPITQPASAAEEVATIRVAAYNVEYGKNASAEEIGAMLKPFNLDLIGFCEAPDGDWTRKVGQVLEMHYVYVGSVSSANHEDKFKTILSRTPLKGAREFSMNTGAVWNPASAVRATTTIRGVTVAFYSMHIAGSDGKVGHAAEFVREIVPQESEPRAIVVGDFNNRLGEPAISLFLDAGLQITWQDLGIDVTTKYTYNALKPEINGGVIDHIFYAKTSGGKATDGAIIELERHLSDHKPVWAEIAFPKNAEE